MQVGNLAAIAVCIRLMHMQYVGQTVGIIVLALIYLHVAIVNHDSVHNATHESKLVNNWIGNVGCFIHGTTLNQKRWHHVWHHRRPDGEQDPEAQLLPQHSGMLFLLEMVLKPCLMEWQTKLLLWKRVSPRVRFEIQLSATWMLIGYTMPELWMVWVIPLHLSQLLFWMLAGFIPHFLLPPSGLFARWFPRLHEYVTYFHDAHHAFENYPAWQWSMLSRSLARYYASRELS